MQPKNPLLILKIINGLNKTLGIAGELIPLYKESKPMIKNAQDSIVKIKDFFNKTTTNINQNKEDIHTKLNNIKKESDSTLPNNPHFFK